MDYTFNPIVGVDFGNKFIKIARWNGSKAEIYCPNGEYLLKSNNVKTSLKNENPNIINDNKACSSIEYSYELISKSILNVSSMFPKDKFSPYAVIMAVPSNFCPLEYSNYKKMCQNLNYDKVFLIPEYIANLFSNGIKDEDVIKEANILSVIFNYKDIDLNLLAVKKGLDYLEVNEELGINLPNLGNEFMDNEFIKFILNAENIDDEGSKSEFGDDLIKLRNKLIYSNKACLEYGNYKEFTNYDMEKALKEYVDMLLAGLNDVKMKITDKKIDRVIVAGNSGNLSFIIDTFKKVFLCENVCVSKNPQYSIAEGAAIYGWYIQENKFTLQSISEVGYGIIDGNGNYIPFIAEYSKIPVEKVLCFTTDTNDMVETELIIANNRGNAISKIEIRNILKKYKGYLDFFVRLRLEGKNTLEVKIIQRDSYIDITQKFNV